MKKFILIVSLLFTGIVMAQPNINQPNDIVVCDDDLDGFAIFDLTANESQTLNGLNPALYTINYYETLADSQAGTNPFANASNFVNIINPQTIYVAVWENADSSNLAVTNFDIIVNLPPDITQPSDITIYENPYDGFAVFDLTSIHSELLNGIDPSSVSITHYETLSDAQSDAGAISNPSAFNNTVPELQQMYVAVSDNNTGCRIIDSYNVIVLDSIVFIPDANFKSKLLQADVTNGIAKDLSDNYFKIDVNSDGEIQESEALEISVLNVYDSSISSLIGIQSMTNIDSLRVNNNSLSTIDLSSNSNLKLLDCSSTSLSTIDISNNLQLKYLNLNDNSLSVLNVTAHADLLALELRNNQFTSLDVGSNLLLQTLDCLGNSLTSIDLSNNTDLEYLQLENNQLTALDVSNNINLISLDFWFNQVSTIDVSNNINLEVFGFYSNLISSVDINNNINLRQLNFGVNPLTSLDVSNNPNLTFLRCIDTSITELDISNNSSIDYLDVRNNSLLTYVNLKNGNDIPGDFSFLFDNSFNLDYVCVNENEFTELAALLSTDGYSASVSSYCSFTPGGDYNTIMGVTKFDDDNNGCDVNDMPFPYIKLNINDGTETGSAFTGSTGNYTFYTQEGNFLITPDLENPTFFNVSPTQVTVDFLTDDNAVFTQDFCITANGIHPEVEIVLAPTTPARPGFVATYLLTYKNNGNQTLSGNMSLAYDDTVLDYVDATETPISQTTGLLTWNFSNLLPFESRSLYVTLDLNSPTDTPAVNIGDELNFIATINLPQGDENPNDNQFVYDQIVVGSYDPNDITCLEGDVVAPTYIGEYLHYIINFENTGTASAENVVVKTTIDPTQFDINSLRLLSTSHDAYARINGNKVEIIFEPILLESGGHGNILLKMKTKSELTANSTVSQNAEIFFDYNFPVETNDANTTFTVLSVSEFGIDNSVNIFPNPVKDVINIISKNAIKNVSTYDIQGRILQSKTVTGTEVTIDLSTQSTGVYFIKITTDKGVYVEKIIKN